MGQRRFAPPDHLLHQQVGWRPHPAALHGPPIDRHRHRLRRLLDAIDWTT
jgi:hypothetical protein